MNELYRAIIFDLCKAITALLLTTGSDHSGMEDQAIARQEAVNTAKVALAKATAACETAAYYQK